MRRVVSGGRRRVCEFDQIPGDHGPSGVKILERAESWSQVKHNRVCNKETVSSP